VKVFVDFARKPDFLQRNLPQFRVFKLSENESVNFIEGSNLEKCMKKRKNKRKNSKERRSENPD
jgi:hypothetical protein